MSPMCLQCDQTEPSCLQCNQARFSCPGYRDPMELNFRDQSKGVAQKARQLVPLRKNESRVVNTDKKKDMRYKQILRTFGGYGSKQPQGLQLDYALSTSPADQSICVFLHNYAPDDSVAVKVHLTTSQIVSHAMSCHAVRCVISTIGLAVIANTKQQPHLMVEAREEYAAALSLTNTALRNERRSLQDTTLTAVLLLAMFEVGVWLLNPIKIP